MIVWGVTPHRRETPQVLLPVGISIHERIMLTGTRPKLHHYHPAQARDRSPPLFPPVQAPTGTVEMKHLSVRLD